MKKTILNFSDSGLSKKVRMMLGAFVVAFFALGLQSAQAQYLPVEAAVERLGTEITLIQSSPSADFAGLEVDAPESNELQNLYYKGVAQEIKKSLNVQQAIDTHHIAFLEKFSTAVTAKAVQYRSEVELMLAD